MTVRHNRIENNYAYAKGGGIALFDQSGSECFNNVIAGNETDTGGGIFIQNCPETSIINCTIAANEATLVVGGICTYQFSYPIIRNSIVYDNIAPLHPSLLSAFDDSFAVSYSDIQGGWEGIQVMDVSPLFASGPDGGYYLSQIESGQPVQSPVVDAGDVTAATLHLDTMTTRTDQLDDIGIVDIGFHYEQNPSAGCIDPRNGPALPSSIAITAYPNPCNSTTIINMTLPRTSSVDLVIHNVLGQQVFASSVGTYPPGNHLISWSGKDNYGQSLATGTYFLTLIASNQSRTQKIIILK